MPVMSSRIAESGHQRACPGEVEDDQVIIALYLTSMRKDSTDWITSLSEFINSHLNEDGLVVYE